MELKTFKIKFMNKILYTFILLLTTSLAFSQIKMEGLVKDSLNNPLELANVILINNYDNFYTYTDNHCNSIYRYCYDILIAKIPYITEGININIIIGKDLI